MSAQPAEKKCTTVYISPDVLEYLAIRRARGAGSVSQQLENLEGVWEIPLLMEE